MSDFSSESGPEKHLVNTYVSDMVALLTHIEKPLQGQLKDADAPHYADASQLLQEIRSTVTSQKTTLTAHLEKIGGSADHGIKSAWATILGVGGAVTGAVRKTKVSKALRDDYTALSLAAISYTMLHTTALGVGDQTTASAAKSGLDQIAPLIIKISKSISAVVLQELQDDGETVKITAAEVSKQQTSEAWSTSSAN